MPWLLAINYSHHAGFLDERARFDFSFNTSRWTVYVFRLSASRL